MKGLKSLFSHLKTIIVHHVTRKRLNRDQSARLDFTILAGSFFVLRVQGMKRDDLNRLPPHVDGHFLLRWFECHFDRFPIVLELFGHLDRPVFPPVIGYDAPEAPFQLYMFDGPFNPDFFHVTG